MYFYIRLDIQARNSGIWAHKVRWGTEEVGAQRQFQFYFDDDDEDGDDDDHEHVEKYKPVFLNPFGNASLYF